MADLFQAIVVAVTSFVVSITSPLTGGTPVSPTPTPIPTQAPKTEQVEVINASGTYSYQGYDVNISIGFPTNGGSVSGNIEGDCNGNIGGTYAGGEDGQIQGVAKGTCSVLFLKVDAGVELSGKVSLNKKQVEMSFAGKAVGLSHAGTVILNFR